MYLREALRKSWVYAIEVARTCDMHPYAIMLALWEEALLLAIPHLLEQDDHLDRDGWGSGSNYQVVRIISSGPIACGVRGESSSIPITF